MLRKQILAVVCIITLLAACNAAEEKVSKEEALKFSASLEKDVKDLKIDFIENNIINPAFISRMYDTKKIKASSGIEQGLKQMLSNNQYEKGIYDIMAGEGSFKMIKQYEKGGSQHAVFRIRGGNGFSYIDMELTKLKERVGIADMFLFSSGENLSASLAELVQKLMTHEKTAIGDALTERLNTISRHLKNTEYEMAKKEFDRLPYDIRNTRLYEIRYLDILSKLDNKQYLEYIKKIELKYGNEPSFQLMMIDVYINQQEWDKAIGSVNQVDSIINKDPFLDYYRGLISNMKGDEKKAAEYFENLVKNDPTFADAYPELIILYAKDRQNEKAKKYYSVYKKMKSADKSLLEYFESNYPMLQSK